MGFESIWNTNETNSALELSLLQTGLHSAWIEWRQPYADSEARKDLLHRDADEGCAGVGRFLSAVVWVDDPDAG
jgi:hypothetical protein